MTPRERVEALDAQGLSTEEIAAELGWTVARVESWLQRIDGVYDPDRQIRVLAEKELRKPKEQRTLRVRKPPPECGTSQSLRLHTVRGETCEVCTAASQERRRVNQARANANYRRKARERVADMTDPGCGDKAGTDAGRMRHIAAKQPLCGPCMDHRNAYQREWRAKRKAAKQGAVS